MAKKRRLTVREHRIVANTVAGMRPGQAITEAGGNRTSASYRRRLQPGGDLWAEAVAALERQGVSLDHVAKRVKESLDAKESKFFAHEGKVNDTRRVVAHGVRLNAADIAYRAFRTYPASKETPETPAKGPVVKIQFLVVQSGQTAAAGKDNAKDVQGIQFRVMGSRRGGEGKTE